MTSHIVTLARKAADLTSSAPRVLGGRAQPSAHLGARQLVDGVELQMASRLAFAIETPRWIGEDRGRSRENEVHVRLVPAELLGGIFVAHYFIETFVWRFRQPFYRQTLGPLYFGSSHPATERAPEALAPLVST